MKLINHLPEAKYNITGHGPGFVLVNQEKFTRSLIISPNRLEDDWVSEMASLTEAHIQRLASWAAGIVILGTGTQLVFPSMALLRPLIDAKIGFEIMDTQAACRTFAVLASEERPVLAALIL